MCVGNSYLNHLLDQELAENLDIKIALARSYVDYRSIQKQLRITRSNLELYHYETGRVPAGLRTIETHFRYNPDAKSLPGIMPAVIPGLLILISAMLSTLSVVREKELGSILNLYVTPGGQAGFPDRQTTVLHRLRDGQLLLSLRAGRVRFRHAAQG